MNDAVLFATMGVMILCLVYAVWAEGREKKEAMLRATRARAEAKQMLAEQRETHSADLHKAEWICDAKISKLEDRIATLEREIAIKNKVIDGLNKTARMREAQEDCA